MSEETSDAWFYSANGQRMGPVGMDQLRELAKSGQLHPRHDHCWTTGMADWVPAGEVEGLFEKKQNAGAGGADTAEEAMERHPQTLDRLTEDELELKLREATWPGASRRIYLFIIWVMPVVVMFFFAGLAILFLDQSDPDDGKLLGKVLIVVMLVIFVLMIHTSLERFRNLGMSRWWILGNMVPILNIWVAYRAICCPAGYEYHRKLDKPGIVLAVIYWGHIGIFVLLMLLSILSLFHAGVGGMFEEMERYLESKFGADEAGEDGQ